MTYYVFGQDMRKADARIAFSSVQEDWYEIEDPVPVVLDDPDRRGDTAPESGSNTFGDIVGGAFSLYSTRLCDALSEFGIALNTRSTQIFTPGNKEPVAGHNMVLGVPDADCLADGFDELEYFEIAPEKTEGLSLFDLEHKLRIIDEKLKQHLDTIGLESVFMIPTTKYGGMLAMRLVNG